MYKRNHFQNRNQRYNHKNTVPANVNPPPVHTVFFFNINYKERSDFFRKFAEKYGEVASIYSVSKKGIHFVTYYDIRDAKKAVEEAPFQVLDGRPVKANFAFRPGYVKENSVVLCSAVQFTPQDSKEYTEEQIINAFGQFGEIRQIRKEDSRYVIKYFDMRSTKKAIESNEPIIIDSELITPTLKLDEEGFDKGPKSQNKLHQQHQQQQRKVSYNQYKESSPESVQQTLPPYTPETFYPNPYPQYMQPTYPNYTQQTYYSYNVVPQQATQNITQTPAPTYQEPKIANSNTAETNKKSKLALLLGL